MKRCLFILCCLVLFAAITGCATRGYITTKDRVDIEVTGNQGVIYGPTPAPHRVADTTRSIFTVDVELPTVGEVKEAVQKKPAEKIK